MNTTKILSLSDRHGLFLPEVWAVDFPDLGYYRLWRGDEVVAAGSCPLEYTAEQVFLHHCGGLSLSIGERFEALNKLGFTGCYEMVYISERSGCVYVGLKAVGRTREDMSIEFDSLRKKNPFCPSIQKMTLDDFCAMEIEVAWFGERKIKKGGA